MRNVVGRLIWESEDEQSVTQVNTPRYKIYTNADNGTHFNHHSWTSFCFTGFP